MEGPIGAANPTLDLCSAAADFNNVTYHRCYDGDTCTFTIPGVHPLFGEKISARIAVVDTPEVKGKCEQEKALAKEARDIVRGILTLSASISLMRNAGNTFMSWREWSRNWEQVTPRATSEYPLAF